MKKELTKRQIASMKNRKKIIEISKELFYNYGYNETTMTDIAKNTGLSIGTIYHLYKSKSEILLDIYETYVNRPLDLTENIDKKVNNPSFFLIEEYIKAINLWVNVGWSVCANFYQLFYSSALESNNFSGVHIKADTIKFISYAQEAGTITKELSPEEIEDILSTHFRGLLYSWYLRQGNYDIVNIAKKQLDIILDRLIN